MRNKSGTVMLSIVSAALLSGCVAYGTAYIPAPPPAQVEVIGVAPYPQAIWVPGYWSWQRRHRQYHWVGGRWKGNKHGHQYDHR